MRLQEALNHAIANNDVATVKAITKLINELNASLSGSGTSLARYIHVDTAAAFKFCLRHYPMFVESAFCWRDIPTEVAVAELRRAAENHDYSLMQLIAYIIKKLDPTKLVMPDGDPTALRILRSLFVAFEFHQWLVNLQQRSRLSQTLFHSEENDVRLLVSLVEHDPALFANHIQFIKTLNLEKKHWLYIHSLLQKHEKLRTDLLDENVGKLSRFFERQEELKNANLSGGACGATSSSSSEATSSEQPVTPVPPMSYQELIAQFREIEPISDDAKQWQAYTFRMALGQEQPVTFTFTTHTDIQLFTIPNVFLRAEKPSLQWLMNVAIEREDAAKYQKYFALSQQVELRLATLGISEFNLGQEFASIVSTQNTLTTQLDAKQEQRLLFLANQHPEYLAQFDAKNHVYRAVLNKVIHLMDPDSFKNFIARFITAKLQNNKKSDLLELVSSEWPFHVAYSYVDPGAFNARATYDNLANLMQYITSNGLLERNDCVRIANEVDKMIFRRSPFSVSSHVYLEAHHGFERGLELRRRNVIFNALFNNPIQDEDRHLQINEDDAPLNIKVRQCYFTRHFDDPSLVETFLCYLDNSQRFINSLSCRGKINDALKLFQENNHLVPFSPDQQNRFVIAECLNTILYYATAKINFELRSRKLAIADAFRILVKFEAGMPGPSIMQAFLTRLKERITPKDKSQMPLNVDPNLVQALEEGYRTAVHEFAKSNAESLLSASKLHSAKGHSSSSSATSSTAVASSATTEKSSSSTADYVYPPQGEPPIASAATVGMFKVAQRQPANDVSNASTSITASTQPVAPIVTVVPPNAAPAAQSEVIRSVEEDLKMLSELRVLDNDLVDDVVPVAGPENSNGASMDDDEPVNERIAAPAM